jgi:hypothetical protein
MKLAAPRPVGTCRRLRDRALHPAQAQQVTRQVDKSISGRLQSNQILRAG